MPSDLQLDVQSVTPDVTLTLSDPYIGSAYSPTVTVNEIEGGHEVTITHKAPSGIVTDTFDVLDGVDGTDGVDGVSPTVEIESTTDAHTITITDADGAHSYTVDTYADEEAARATAESSRVAAEQSRVTAESARAAAESARDDAESARSAAEATRAENEGTRVTNETTRVNAESARAEAEQAREQAETSREAAWDALSTQAISVTQAANNAAQTASQAASAAYSAAQSASQAESTTTANETARASAEQGRVAAEQGRVTAEQNRATAETTRATEWATIKTEAETATSDANVAASDATAAAATARAASAATWLSGNVLFGELEEAAVLTTDDAFTAPPKGVDVFGKSTQDGTPTPDAPVEIKSVDDLTLWLCGKNLLDRSTEVSGYIQQTGYPYEYSSTGWLVSSYVPVAGGTTYTFNPNSTAGSTAMGCFYYADKTPIVASIFSSGPITITAPAEAKFVRVSYRDTSTNVQLELGTTATAYEPYVGASVSIPLSNNSLRSLPDGTRDTVTLSYVGPSMEHEGWGVYSKTLVQTVGQDTIANVPNWEIDSNPHVLISGFVSDMATDSHSSGKLVMCNKLMAEDARGYGSVSAMADDSICKRGTLNKLFIKTGTEYETVSSFLSELGDTVIYYPLATPITTDLGTVELPVNPAPDLTAWADGGSAAPTLSMEYEQDINIVIGRLRDAIADIATS